MRGVGIAVAAILAGAAVPSSVARTEPGRWPHALDATPAAPAPQMESGSPHGGWVNRPDVPMSFDRSPYAPYQSMVPGGAHPLAPDEVASSLSERGFSKVGRIERRGRAYICRATGPRGERVQLVVDADSGEISGMQLLGYDREP